MKNRNWLLISHFILRQPKCQLEDENHGGAKNCENEDQPTFKNKRKCLAKEEIKLLYALAFKGYMFFFRRA